MLVLVNAMRQDNDAKTPDRDSMRAYDWILPYRIVSFAILLQSYDDCSILTNSIWFYLLPSFRSHFLFNFR